MFMFNARGMTAPGDVVCYTSEINTAMFYAGEMTTSGDIIFMKEE